MSIKLLRASTVWILLQVKKKALCTLFPCPLVRPDIKPGDLSRAGGPDLLHKIRELTLKEAKYRLEQQGVGDKIVGSEEALPNRLEVVGEDTTLLVQGIQNLNEQDKNRTLKVELEGGLPSTREMGDRDKMDVEEEI